MRCKRWTCEECMPIRLAQLQVLAECGRPLRFITLTSRYGSTATAAQAAQELRTAWQRIVQIYNRRHGKNAVQYLAVFEATEKGWPHLHILQRGPYMPVRELSSIMRERTGSPIVHIRRVRGEREAAYYIAKYVSKGPTRWQGCKRYWRSMRWALSNAKPWVRPVADIGKWSIAGMNIAHAATKYVRFGWIVKWSNERAFTARAGPNGLPMIWPDPRDWAWVGRSPL